MLSQHALQQVSSRGVCSGGVPAPRGETPPKADGYCCGRYASYWNAFLFLMFCLFNGQLDPFY